MSFQICYLLSPPSFDARLAPSLNSNLERQPVSPTETAESTKREIEVQVPAEEVVRETDALIQKYQKLARIPGFRRGHVPASVIRQRFKQDIQNDVVDALVPKYFRKEAERLGLSPISQPRVTDLHVHDGQGLHFKASFEVMPEIKVAGYQELRAEHPEITITEHAIPEGREYRFTLRARSFLHNQLRSIVGSLERVGSGTWPPERIAAALAARNRAACGPVCPPQGLYLTGVGYQDDPFKS